MAGRKNSIPPLSVRQWYATDVAIALYAAVPSILAGGLTLQQTMADKHRELVPLAALTLATVVGGAIGKLIHSVGRDRQEQEIASHLDYTACVYTVYLTLCHWKGLRFGDEEDRKKLRITIHRVDRDKGLVTQLIDYVGAQGGPRGRTFPIFGGVVGRVVTGDDDIAELHRAKGSSSQDYVRLLQQHWAMLREQAAALSMDRYDFLAVAIRGDNDAIVGVMYLDSNEPGFFDEATQELVVAGCSGVAQYTKFRYGKQRG